MTTVYPINAEVHWTASKTQVTSLSYEFDFLQTDTYELGGTFGIHNIGFEFGISAEAQGQTAATSTKAEADGPLPVIGLRGVWRINDKFYLDAGIQYFQISFDPYDGSITDSHLVGRLAVLRALGHRRGLEPVPHQPGS